MIVPEDCQIFDHPVYLSDKDAERLRPHLSAWHKLHELMLLGINEPDLERLVVLELIFDQRREILKRLLGRLSQQRQATMHEKIDKILTL